MSDPLDNGAKELTMERNEYTLAGWLAIAAAVLILPAFVLGIATEVVKHRAPGLVLALLVPYILITICSTVFGIYVLLRFRTLLNRRHGFHAIDGLVTAIVIGVAMITLYALPMKLLSLTGAINRPPLLVLAIVPVAVIGITLGILGIIAGVRLLRLPTDAASYERVYAWLSIAAGICFVTFFLAPLGGLIDAASNIVLAMLFLKPEGEETAPEFV
jgi:hypothetical protein